MLLVEDDEDARTLLLRTLQSNGARVVAVASASQAVHELEQHHADVLVSDLRLPLRDGFALIRELRSRSDPRLRSIPAASITGSSTSEDRHRALAAGYQVHLQKPVDPDDLVRAVLSLANRRRDGPMA